ncbi:LacI family DNA-binding transcriptional regulator [Aestuariivivens sediminis]|uniref:LacI family DNA-binding transcriptional regulator n=1 Tax=Aestuariivivens sediminis TaxID=2913557 RepID=UPI001F58D7D0|nr:LacI family DNA-binding transcriptional regulator [Aestuariivivens sediminis]
MVGLRITGIHILTAWSIKMVTIKDIAREAQVSEGTVDRVLHNRGGVSKQTETKIKAILKKHNFTINPVASALASKNKYHIAVLIPKFSDTDIFWKSPYMGIQKAAHDYRSFGIDVRFYRFDQYDSRSYENHFKALLRTTPSIVLVVPLFLKETKRFVGELEQQSIPYMFLNIDVQGFHNMTFIGQDSYTAGYLAGKLMHSIFSEDTNVLIIHSKHNTSVNQTVSKRIEGFTDFFAKQHFKNRPLILKIDAFNTSKETKAAITTFLKKHPKVKGLFIPSSRINIIVDCIAPALLKHYRMIGFDNTPKNIECLENESVSFLISQKPFDQGYESIQVMADYLLKKKIPNDKIYLPIDILTKENVKYNERNELLFEMGNL